MALRNVDVAYRVCGTEEERMGRGIEERKVGCCIEEWGEWT